VVGKLTIADCRLKIGQPKISNPKSSIENRQSKMLNPKSSIDNHQSSIL